MSSAAFTIYTPGTGTLSYTVSSPLGRLQICTLCCNYNQSLQFRLLVPSGTHHCLMERGGMIWETCPTPLHMTSIMTRTPVSYIGSQSLQFTEDTGRQYEKLTKAKRTSVNAVTSVTEVRSVLSIFNHSN